MKHAVLITGAGARLGRALALGLAKDGHAIAVHYNRSKDGADSLVKSIAGAGGTAASVRANLFVPQDLDTLVARASAALGSPLTGLINNASTFSMDSARNMTRASYDYHMDINLRAPLLLAGQFQKQCPKDAGGFIINMLDQRVLNPDPTFFSYSIAKSAMQWATQTLAQELAPYIRVSAIGPGPSLASIHQDAETFEAEIETTLLKRGSPPEDLLAAARYLIAARSVTGQMIAVDGGQHLAWDNTDTAENDTSGESHD